MVNRLRADEEVVVESRGPVTVADESHTRPHHDSRAARCAELSGGPAPHPSGFRRRQTDRPGQRPDPRPTHHLLHAQGRHAASTLGRGTDRPRAPERDRCFHRRCLPHPARLRAGRTVMSAVVSVVIGLASLMPGLPRVFTIMVVNFIGGYIPYIGAFFGGGLAVIVALGDGGLRQAAVMLVVVLASNLALEKLRRTQGDGTLPRHPPAGGAHRDRVGRPHRRHCRPHLGRALLCDRSQRHRSSSVVFGRGLLRPGGRPRPTDPATHPQLRWAT
jgi:hypothetical protein